MGYSLHTPLHSIKKITAVCNVSFVEVKIAALFSSISIFFSFLRLVLLPGLFADRNSMSKCENLLPCFNDEAIDMYGQKIFNHSWRLKSRLVNYYKSDMLDRFHVFMD